MTRSEHLIHSISDTAFLTAAYRAEESTRPDALFSDPFARRLAGQRGAEIARTTRQPLVRSAVTSRTVAIDRIITAAVQERGCETVLNLAAGLDARPYRMDLPDSLRWIEVDLAAVMEYKTEALRDASPACRLETITLDLANEADRQALLEQVDVSSRRALVLTEGLLQYWSAEAVAALAHDLSAQASITEWATDLTGPQVGNRQRFSALSTPFAPAESTGFFRPYGWIEAEYVDFFMDASALGRDSLTGKIMRTIARSLPARMRRGFERGVGVARLVRV